MKLLGALPDFLNGDFWVLEQNRPHASKLSVELSHENGNSCVISLEELFSTDMLKNKVTFYREKDYYKREALISQYLLNGPKTNPFQLELRCQFAELYDEVCKTIPYEFNEKPEEFSQRINEFLNTENTNLIEEITDHEVPKIILTEDYDLELIKLIFQMRQHLFIETDVKLNPEKLYYMFNFYQLSIFDRNLTVDVFLKFENNMHAHLKMKCEIVFGINLYCLLQKEDLLDIFKEELFRDPKQVLSDREANRPNTFNFLRTVAVDLLHLNTLIIDLEKLYNDEDYQPLCDVKTDAEYAETLPLYEHLSFLRQLFRIVEVGCNISNKTYRINFIGALNNLGYKYIRGDQLCLTNQINTRTYNCATFLNFFNEENTIFRKIRRFDFSVTGERVADLEEVIFAVLQLLPEIRALRVSTTARTEYNEVVADDYTYYDMFIESLLSKNEQVLNNLNEFKMDGFNRLSLTTVLNLKQCKFEKFGLRGIFSCVDELYLYLLFSEENIKTLRELHNIYKIEDTLNIVDESDAVKYNNLRNSVTHLTCNEDIFRNALMYGFLENIQGASVYFHTYRNNHVLNSVEKLIANKLESYKKKCTNAKQMPLPLRFLKIYPAHTYMRNFLTNLRAFSRELCIRKEVVGMQNDPESDHFSEIMENITCVYEVSELVLADSSCSYTSPDFKPAIGWLVRLRDSFGISVAAEDMHKSVSFYQALENFGLTGKKIVLSFSNNPFNVPGKYEPLYHEWYGLMHIMWCIYYFYLRTSSSANLVIHFHSQNCDVLNRDAIRKQVFDYIVKTWDGYRHHTTPCDRSVLHKKISIEIEGQISEQKDE